MHRLVLAAASRTTFREASTTRKVTWPDEPGKIDLAVPPVWCHPCKSCDLTEQNIGFSTEMYQRGRGMVC